MNANSIQQTPDEQAAPAEDTRTATTSAERRCMIPTQPQIPVTRESVPIPVSVPPPRDMRLTMPEIPSAKRPGAYKIINK